MTFLDVLDEVYPRSNDNADNVDAAYALWFDGYICMNDGLVESPESADLIEPVISEPFKNQCQRKWQSFSYRICFV